LSLHKPETLEGYAELRRWLLGLKKADRISDWADAMRWYCLHDLFFLLNDVLSDGKQPNQETGAPLFFHQFYLDWCRQIEWQTENGGGFDASARRIGKSTLRTKASNIQRMLRYPDSAGCLFSYQRRAAKKHIRALKLELETNDLLKTLFDDVLFEDPITAARNAETVWSIEDGLCVKRKVIRRELSMEYNAFMDGTPTGGGYDRLDFDDVEDHKALNTEDQLEKLHKSYDSAVNLLTPNILSRPVLMFTNTFYSKTGLAWRVYEQYKDEPKKVNKVPAEDLDAEGDGPLGGAPNYPFTAERLNRIYKEQRDKREYSIQYCCDFRAGEDRTFENHWLQRYEEAPEVIGRGRNIYICIDPSRGITDPMAIWVWGLGADRKAVWLDVSLKRLDPALPEFYDEIFMMVAKWSNLGRRVIEIRVENFGQNLWHSLIARELERRGLYGIRVIPCADNVRTRKFSSGKRDREFERWALPAKQGEVMIPKPVSEEGAGLMRRDEKGVIRDIVQVFLDDEWNEFPKCVSDNLLDAGSLLWEPEDKMGAPLQFPAPHVRRSSNRFGGRRTSAMSAG
jgi:hypothetical protein